MTDNITQFPEPSRPDLLIGPFEHWHVVVDGRLMPHLTGFREGDKIWLVVDGRFGCGPFDEDAARQAARLAGQAMAVVAGYSHLGADSKDQPFAPTCSELPSNPA
jgi:hypothetical protein